MLSILSIHSFRIHPTQPHLAGHTSANVSEAVLWSEASRTKCIGITIETRPDYCLTPHLTSMLAYGCTRLEVGLQSIYEDVARDTNRGHTVEAVKSCFRLSKDAGYKVQELTKRRRFFYFLLKSFILWFFILEGTQLLFGI